MSFQFLSFRVVNPRSVPNKLVTCPKCRFNSGDDWDQCNGQCPMPGSPHYDELTAHAFQLIPLAEPRE